MPGPGSTTKKCASCSMPLNVACKTCKYCKAAQPHNLRLKKKIERFDLKSETWAQAQKKNNTSSHLMDDASLLVCYRLLLFLFFWLAYISNQTPLSFSFRFTLIDTSS